MLAGVGVTTRSHSGGGGQGSQMSDTPDGEAREEDEHQAAGESVRVCDVQSQELRREHGTHGLVLGDKHLHLDDDQHAKAEDEPKREQARQRVVRAESVRAEFDERDEKKEREALAEDDLVDRARSDEDSVADETHSALLLDQLPKRQCKQTGQAAPQNQFQG